MYKDLSQYKWINSNENIKLNPDEYLIVINPKIIHVDKICHYEYEQCGSFKFFNVKARRPLYLVASFYNEKGELIEKEFFDFEARVFSHEYDHLSGVPFIHWRISDCDIELKEEYKEEFDNLIYTIEYYRNRLSDEKLSKPNLFEKFDLPIINEIDLDKQFIIEDELRIKNKLNFEELMLIDIEKAIRKDLRMKLKQNKNI